MNATGAVTEDDLQAYVDDALDAASRDRVERHLAGTPADAGRVEEYRRQRQLLRRALRPIAEEPVPARLAEAALGREASRPSPRRGLRATPQLARAACVALACLAAGGVLGWRLAPRPSPFATGPRPLAEEAADSYRAYAGDEAHPVEVSAADRPALLDWVSSRLGKRVEAPASAAGLPLLGGRVVPTSRGPAAMFMYADAAHHGAPAVLLVCPLSLHGSAPMAEAVRARLTSFTWSDRGIGYSLIGDMPAARLRAMAEAVRRDFGQGGLGRNG